MTTNRADDLAGDAPYLTAEPPPLAASGLSWILIALFAAVAVLSVVLRLPETVTCTFVLAPVKGADPVRAPRGGTLTRVSAVEGSSVAGGATLFALRSQELGDRSAELQTLESQLRGGGDGLANARRKFESESLASQEELNRLLARSAYLDRMVALKKEQIALTAEQADRARKLNEQGLTSVNERSDALIRHSQSVMELEQLQGERKENESAIGKLRHTDDGRRTDYREQERGLAERMEAARIRSTVLSGGRPGSAGGERAAAANGELVVTAPCAGTVTLVSVRAPGAVVREGEVLAEVACAGEKLHAELSVPQGGVAQVRVGEPVKLLYDAFPYQRYGVKAGTVTWASPATVAVNGAPSFRVFVGLEDESVRVNGQPRPLLPGMGGTARVVVGRRSVLSYAFAPLRQLRENLR